MAQYAQIVEIIVPDQASPGDLVNVTVRIKNLYSDLMGIKVASIPEFDYSLGFAVDTANVNPGETYSFYGSFIMPDRAVYVHAYSFWYGSDANWYQDDAISKLVNLAAVPANPQISGFQIADFYAI